MIHPPSEKDLHSLRIAITRPPLSVSRYLEESTRRIRSAFGLTHAAYYRLSFSSRLFLVSADPPEYQAKLEGRPERFCKVDLPERATEGSGLVSVCYDLNCDDRSGKGEAVYCPNVTKRGAPHQGYYVAVDPKIQSEVALPIFSDFSGSDEPGPGVKTSTDRRMIGVLLLSSGQTDDFSLLLEECLPRIADMLGRRASWDLLRELEDHWEKIYQQIASLIEIDSFPEFFSRVLEILGDELGQHALKFASTLR